LGYYNPGIGVIYKDSLLPVFVYVGEMDNTKVSLRSTDEPWLENINTIGFI